LRVAAAWRRETAYFCISARSAARGAPSDTESIFGPTNWVGGTAPRIDRNPHSRTHEWRNAAGSGGQEEGKTHEHRTETDDGERAAGQGLGTHAREHGPRWIAYSLTIRFQIDGDGHVRATRVAKLDQLAKAISAIDEDIGRLVEGAPALNYGYCSDIERLRQEKSALVELQKRAGRSGCAGSITVIEALFPDIPVKKKTASEDAEDEQRLAIRKEAGLKIDPETAEVEWKYRQTLDPYGIRDEWELPEEFHQWGREFFARSPGSDIWVHFSHLPDGVEEKLWTKLGSQIGFPPGLEGMPPTGTEDADLPF
jgi:hypothetical protein